MIQIKTRFFLRSLRVLYQNENLKELLNKKKYDYITVISYGDLGLEKDGFGIVHKKVANIHLNGSIEEILNRFSRRTKQEVNNTFKIPELDFRIDDKDIASTFRLYKEFERAQKRKPWKIESFEGTILFNAYYKRKLIASIPCYDIFPHLQVRAIFSQRLKSGIDKELYKIIGLVTRRLIYEICKYGKEKGYLFVGLGSVNYSTPQKANVANFKMFFGSELGDEYTYVYKSPKFVFLEKIRNFIKKFFRI